MAKTRGDAYPCAAHDGEHLRQYQIAKVELAREVMRGGGTAGGGLRIGPLDDIGDCSSPNAPVTDDDTLTEMHSLTPAHDHALRSSIACGPPILHSKILDKMNNRPYRNDSTPASIPSV